MKVTAAKWLVLAVSLAGWAGVYAYRRPAASYARALPALSGSDPALLEQLQYESLNVANSPLFEPQASLLKGKLLISAGRYTAALDALTIAGDDRRTRVPALVLTGEALYRSGRFLEAGDAWTRAIELAPDNIEAYRWLGVAYYDLGAVFEAVHYLKKVAQLDPSDPRPHRIMGVLWRDVDDFNSAVDAYRESLRRDPRQPEADQVRFELAQALDELHRDREALEALRDAADDPAVVTLRAACHYGLGQLDEAARLLDQAIEADPQQFKALTIRAKVALERSETELAAKLAHRAARIRPRSSEALGLVVAASLRLGDEEQAEAGKEALQEVNQLRDEYHRLLEQAVSDPRDAQVRYRLGILADRLDLMEAAKRWLRASVNLDPDNAEAAAALGKLEQPYQRYQTLH